MAIFATAPSVPAPGGSKLAGSDSGVAAIYPTPTAARNEIGPLLDQLIRQLDTEGRATQRAHFDRIRRCLYLARHDTELNTPILELSTSIAVGFSFSNEADVLITRILEKAEGLARELEYADPKHH